MKKVLFQVATEFHYMVALSIIEKYYYGKEYEIHFIIVSSDNNKRLINLNLDNLYFYHKLEYNHHDEVVNENIIFIRKFIEITTFYHFISFLYHDPLFVFLTYYLKKNGTKCFLAPDGMGAYVKFTKMHLRSRIINTLKCYKFFKLHGFKFPKIWFTSWDFGKNGYYDCIYAYSKELPTIKNKTIIEIDYSISYDNIHKLKKLFSIDFSTYPPLSKVALIINDRHNMPIYESKLLEIISKELPDYKIIVKKHPGQKIENLTYLNDTIFKISDVYPVELLIASLKGGIVISSYSNSMLYYNPKCHYFWTYPIASDSGELRKSIKRYNPKKHIHVLESFDEMKNCLKKTQNG